MSPNIKFETDTIPTSNGELEISFLGHGSLLFEVNHKHIYIDVYGEVADYSQLPKADLILLTHEHSDHFDPIAIKQVWMDQTQLIYTSACSQKLEGGHVLNNGESFIHDEFRIEAVPAYNLLHKRANVTPFHPKGVGNGYILDFGNTRLYIAGDTENIPEMKCLKDIYIAFLPMNLPYTMTPEMVADAARSFHPHILYPYHYGKTDPNELITLLRGEKEIEVRVRNMP